MEHTQSIRFPKLFSRFHYISLHPLAFWEPPASIIHLEHQFHEEFPRFGFRNALQLENQTLPWHVNIRQPSACEIKVASNGIPLNNESS